MLNHIAALKTGLTDEKWARNVEEETQLKVSMAQTEKASREAIKQRKEAEKMRQMAEDKKAAEERRWAIREEEKRRYTTEQRAWWDAEMAHAKANNRSREETGRTHESTAAAAEKQAILEREQKAIIAREKRVREGHEKDVEGWDREWKDHRNADQMAMREHIAGEHTRQQRQDSTTRRVVKADMSKAAVAQANREAADLAKKMALGEEERKGREENRQTLEEAKQAAKQVDFDQKTSMFLRDEVRGRRSAHERATVSRPWRVAWQVPRTRPGAARRTPHAARAAAQRAPGARQPCPRARLHTVVIGVGARACWMGAQAARYGEKEMKANKQKKRLEDGKDKMKQLVRSLGAIEPDGPR